MLARSPLIMVLAQIRFPMEVVKLKPNNGVAVDAAMGSAGFPLLQSDTSVSVDTGAGGMLQFPGHPESRMYYTADMSMAVTINPVFVSLYCVDRGEGIPYRGHEAFIEMLDGVARSLEEVVGEVLVERMGYRYVDAMKIPDAQDVLMDSFKGPAPLNADSSLGLAVTSATVDAFFANAVEGAELGAEPPVEGAHVACGTVVPGSIIDPAIPPKQDARWIVDIDAYSRKQFTFSAAAVREKASTLASFGRNIFYNHVVNSCFPTRFDD